MAARRTTDDDVALGEPDETERARRAFAEEFGLIWDAAGSPAMDGRILGYLLVMREPYISSSGIAAAVSASAGAVSMSTRRLVEAGFVKRQAVAGDRSHHFRVERDVWGSWLAGERRYLDVTRELIERGLDLLGDGPEDEAAQQRLVNGRDYFRWLATYHRRMLADWEEFKRGRDAASDAGPDPAADEPPTTVDGA